MLFSTSTSTSTSKDVRHGDPPRQPFVMVPTMLLLLNLLCAPSVTANALIPEDINQEATVTDCTLFMAPSSIPGSGFGLYVGNRTFAKGEPVSHKEAVIPIIELKWNNGMQNNFTFLWEQYTWAISAFAGMEVEVDNPRLMAVASPGIGSVANSYLSLVNLRDVPFEPELQVPRSSPGIGAMSLYQGRQHVTTMDLEPGTELFVSYGEKYFRSRHKSYGYIPFPGDYAAADDLLRELQFIRQQYLSPSHRKRTKASKRLARLETSLYSMIQVQIRSIWQDARVLNALPSDPSGIDVILQQGGTAKQHFGRSIKSLEWLQEYGQCTDALRDGVSTIPHAGRGAFAVRDIAMNALVAPLPLIHVPDKSIFRMYNTRYEDGRQVPDAGGSMHAQLLLNYCFSHEASTLLLCPYGLLSSLINHSSKNTNARIQWSKARHMRHHEWLHEPISEWGDVEHAGLAFDAIATRTIQAGEEVLIDYGDAWDDAWAAHVKSFVARTGSLSALELNRDLAEPLRAELDESYIPYEDSGVELWCRGYYIQRFRSDGATKDARCRIIRRIERDRHGGRRIGSSTRKSITMHADVTARRTRTTNSTAQADEEIHDMVNDPEHENEYEFEHKYEYVARRVVLLVQKDVETRQSKEVFWKLPREAFYFEDLPYQRDHHWHGSFRYPMQIPDDIFPDVWKNLNESTGIRSLLTW